MRRYVIGIVSLIVLCLPLFSAWAGYNGPVEIYSGQINNINTKNTDDGEVFINKYFVRSDGSYVEVDINDNASVYGSSGLLKQFNVSQGPGFQSRVFFTDQFIYVIGGILDSQGTLPDNIYLYDYTGTLRSTIKYGTYNGDFESALSNGDFITQVGKSDNYYRYSLSGQLLKSYTSRPLELGVVKSQPLGDRKYKTTITFDDASYTILISYKYDKAVKILRDENKNIYLLSGYVTKYSPCGKLLGEVKKPSDVVFREQNVTGREPEVIVHEQYDEPVMDIHGNVYVMKTMQTKYSILKWTWVDDPNSPSGPDAPTNLSVAASINGLYLTWIASPQDPGCVTGYEISRATSAGGVGTTVGAVNAGTLKYTDTSASAGTMYYYKIRAVSGTDYSLYTSEVSGKR